MTSDYNKAVCGLLEILVKENANPTKQEELTELLANAQQYLPYAPSSPRSDILRNVNSRLRDFETLMTNRLVSLERDLHQKIEIVAVKNHEGNERLADQNPRAVILSSSTGESANVGSSENVSSLKAGVLQIGDCTSKLVHALEQKIQKIDEQLDENRKEVMGLRRMMLSSERDMEDFTGAMDAMNVDVDEVRDKINEILKNPVFFNNASARGGALPFEAEIIDLIDRVTKMGLQDAASGLRRHDILLEELQELMRNLNKNHEVNFDDLRNLKIDMSKSCDIHSMFRKDIEKCNIDLTGMRNDLNQFQAKNVDRVDAHDLAIKGNADRVDAHDAQMKVFSTRLADMEQEFSKLTTAQSNLKPEVEKRITEVEKEINGLRSGLVNCQTSVSECFNDVSNLKEELEQQIVDFKNELEAKMQVCEEKFRENMSDCVDVCENQYEESKRRQNTIELNLNTLTNEIREISENQLPTTKESVDEFTTRLEQVDHRLSKNAKEIEEIVVTKQDFQIQLDNFLQTFAEKQRAHEKRQANGGISNDAMVAGLEMLAKAVIKISHLTGLISVASSNNAQRHDNLSSEWANVDVLHENVDLDSLMDYCSTLMFRMEKLWRLREPRCKNMYELLKSKADSSMLQLMEISRDHIEGLIRKSTTEREAFISMVKTTSHSNPFSNLNTSSLSNNSNAVTSTNASAILPPSLHGNHGGNSSPHGNPGVGINPLGSPGHGSLGLGHGISTTSPAPAVPTLNSPNRYDNPGGITNPRYGIPLNSEMPGNGYGRSGNSASNHGAHPIIGQHPVMPSETRTEIRPPMGVRPTGVGALHSASRGGKMSDTWNSPSLGNPNSHHIASNPLHMSSNQHQMIANRIGELEPPASSYAMPTHTETNAAGKVEILNLDFDNGTFEQNDRYNGHQSSGVMNRNLESSHERNGEQDSSDRGNVKQPLILPLKERAINAPKWREKRIAARENVESKEAARSKEQLRSEEAARAREASGSKTASKEVGASHSEQLVTNPQSGASRSNSRSNLRVNSKDSRSDSKRYRKFEEAVSRRCEQSAEQDVRKKRHTTAVVQSAMVRPCNREAPKFMDDMASTRVPEESLESNFVPRESSSYTSFDKLNCSKTESSTFGTSKTGSKGRAEDLEALEDNVNALEDNVSTQEKLAEPLVDSPPIRPPTLENRPITRATIAHAGEKVGITRGNSSGNHSLESFAAKKTNTEAEETKSNTAVMMETPKGVNIRLIDSLKENTSEKLVSLETAAEIKQTNETRVLSSSK